MMLQTNTNVPHHSFSTILPARCGGNKPNPMPQTGSTHGNSSLRGGPRGRGHGCNSRGSGRGSQQYPIDDAFADTSVRDHAGLSIRVDPPYALRRTSRSQNQLSVLNHQ